VSRDTNLNTAHAATPAAITHSATAVAFCDCA
jgi:hypothetical protein